MLFQETAMSNAWYEALSVLHLMAMLSLSQANLLLLPRGSADGCQAKVSEGINSFWKKNTLLLYSLSYFLFFSWLQF